ncbi:ParB N-terminal domain-containing protein (plasmid) [Sulfitobacter sp. LCG007]
MSGSRNKFGFAPLETDPAPRARSVGPMGAAVREAAESLTEATEAKVEQRRRNAEDARAYRAAQEEGRVLRRLPLAEIGTDDLPRDRLELEAVAASDAMEELKASIRARGQKEPVEVYVGSDGRYQLKKGWRRLTALRQLLDETGDDAFAEIVARVEEGEADRLARYIDMVEENVVREDLTFAEMAQVAITAAEDPALDGVDADALVGRLYGSLHKMKRSYIRSFVTLLNELGPALRFPKEVSRNLGVDVVRTMKAGRGAGALRAALEGVATAEDQAKVLADFVAQQTRPAPAGKRGLKQEKFEFRVGSVKVTARRGECRIVGTQDYASVPRDRLERAVKAFEAALAEEGNPRVTSL